MKPDTTKVSRKCSECDFAILADFGYSNYTVEGTTVYCSKHLHPDGEFDHWYGESEKDLFANKCSEFSSIEGPVMVDVEGEEIDAGSWEAYATACVPADVIKDLLG